MKPFDLEAAKRGAAVCMKNGKPIEIITLNGRSNEFPILAYAGFSARVMSFSAKGQYRLKYESNEDLMMRDDDYLERLERGEYRNHIADANKMGDSVVKRNLITETPTCKESLPVGLTKREWFAGMALAGEIAGFLAGDRGVNGEEKGVPKVIAEDAVLFADALVAELEKNNERCSSCQDRFDMICNRYRAVYNSAKDKDDLKDKLNKFRAGYL